MEYFPNGASFAYLSWGQVRDAKMKRLKAVRFLRGDKQNDLREPTILDHGDPITVQLTRQIEERKRRMNMSDAHPAGL